MDVGECLKILQGVQHEIEKMRRGSNPYRQVLLDNVDHEIAIATSSLCQLYSADRDAEKLGASK